MAQQKHRILKDLPPILRYGLAVGSVALALGLALLLQRYNFRGVEFPLFLFAIAVSVWYAGLWPGVLAVVLSMPGLQLLLHRAPLHFLCRAC